MYTPENNTYGSDELYSYTLEVLRGIERDYALFRDIQKVFPNKVLTIEDYKTAATQTLNEACKTLLEDDVEAITPTFRGMIIGFSIDDSATLTFRIKQKGIKDPRPVSVSEVISLSRLSKYDAHLIMSL